MTAKEVQEIHDQWANMCIYSALGLDFLIFMGWLAGKMALAFVQPTH
jgi:hypothetical protein